MKKFVNKFFYWLFTLTILICMGTQKIACMDNTQTTQSDNYLAPLRALLNQEITRSAIQEAFSDTFGVICQIIVKINKPSETKLWLESQETMTDISRLIEQLKARFDSEFSQDFKDEIQQAQMYTLSTGIPVIPSELYYIRLRKTLYYEAGQLPRKIKILIDILNKIITSGQKPDYLNDAQDLQETVESQIPREAWLCMWPGLPTYVSGSCTLL